MTKSGFVIANLFRKRTRPSDLLSVDQAFLPVRLAAVVNHVFNAGAQLRRRHTPDGQARVSFTSRCASAWCQARGGAGGGRGWRTRSGLGGVCRRTPRCSCFQWTRCVP